MKRVLTTMLPATVLASIPVFAGRRETVEPQELTKPC
jgi:hypothetical protein